MRHGSLFSGIGGFDLAAEWMGWENVFHCEINEFCQTVLKFYWPKAKLFKDITNSDFKSYAETIDVLSAGFPCQPFSNAGEQLGEQDERYLVEEMLRVFREIKPGWFIGENVYAIASRKFSRVFEYICAQVEAEGYEVQPYTIPATAVGAEHERYRTWFVAHSKRERQQRQRRSVKQVHPTKIGNRETNRFVDAFQRNALPFLCDSHNGLPRRLAEQALHAAGNAVAPQIPFQIFKTIEQYEQLAERF